MIWSLTFLAVTAFASADVIYPCEQSLTAFCVGAWLEQAAGCRVPLNIVSAEFTDDPILIELPFFKGSVQKTETKYVGIADGQISAFFTDSSLNKTVLSVTFPEVVSSGRVNLLYHQAGTIDYELDTAFQTTYKNTVVTAQWNGVDQITIGTAKVYPETESSSYDIAANWPELAAEIQSNPSGIAARTAALSAENPDVLLSEESLYVGRAFARLYWKTFLCSNLP